MYEQQGTRDGSLRAGPDMNAGADNSSYQSDDVVDGDYKEYKKSNFLWGKFLHRNC